jgi:hypothetical protein
MAVSRRGSCEFSAAVGASRLGCLARLLSLVSEEVAKGRELPAVAAVLPATGLWAVLHYADVAGAVLASRAASAASAAASL